MIKIAAVQGAPKYLDLTGTLGKMKTILEKAADNGCQLKWTTFRAPSSISFTKRRI